MRNIDIAAKAIAAAITACNKGRITSDAAKTAKQWIFSNADADDTIDTMEVFANLSALNQELERHGLVQTDRAKPALITAIEKALASQPATTTTTQP